MPSQASEIIFRVLSYFKSLKSETQTLQEMKKITSEAAGKVRKSTRIYGGTVLIILLKLFWIKWSSSGAKRKILVKFLQKRVMLQRHE